MPISTPDKIITPWATSGLKDDIPENADPINGRAGFDLGFPPINLTPKTAGGIPPFGQDFNGIFFDVTQALQFLQAGGSFPYDGTWATAVGGYPIGALVSRTDNQGLWRNTVANNLTDPEAGGAGWQPEGSGATTVAMASSNVTLTPLQAATEIIIITGTLTANLQLVFPEYVKQWLIVNNASGAFTVTCKTPAGTGIATSPGETVTVYGDGTNIESASQVAGGDFPFGYFSGFQMSNNSGSPLTAIDVAPGAARDSLNASNIYIPVQIVGILQSSGAWAAGNNQNKLDTGARANNTWYHVFAIRRTSDGAGDILFSTSSSAPTMPSGYAGLRRIGAMRTDGSGNIIGFINIGNLFLYKTPIRDASVTGVTNPSSANIALTTPSGVRTIAQCSLWLSGNGPIGMLRATDSDAVTLATAVFGNYIGGLYQNTNDSSEQISAPYEVPTNTSSTVTLQMAQAGSGTLAYVVVTNGYKENR